MTAIARTAEDKNRRSDCFDKIENSSRHLLDLINDILDMAKIDSGNFDLAPQKFSFGAAVEQVITQITAAAEEKKQNFTSKIDPAIPDSLIADERRLKQVLINLLSNAVKFTPEKGVISFSAVKMSSAEGACAIRFEVQETGIGISDETKKRLWNAFEQADNSITRSHGGTGLGLAITKQIVQMMDGTIEVESEAGKGSRFICTVRLKVNSNPAADAGSGDASPSSLTGRRILVVDDVEMNREIVFAILEDTGAVPESAQDGREAVEMVSKNKYDIVLMDLHMPNMDGFEATRHIRASGLKGTDTLPIIAVTADTGGDVVSRCLEAGMNGHLGKPVIDAGHHGEQVPSNQHIMDVSDDEIGVGQLPVGGHGAGHES
jgi:CheY-like chemotaxis protein